MAMAVAPRPQVLVVEEAHVAQFNAYIDELQKQTGQTWHGVIAPLCGLGQWTGTACSSPYFQGVAIFTTFGIVSSDSMFFPFADCWQSARTGLRAGVNVNGTTVHVFVTHLQHDDGCANDAQSRYSSMAMLKSWAAGYSAPQIIGGDLNAQADQIDTTNGMVPNFVDVWSRIGSGSGATAYMPNPTVRIDYWFTDATLKATPVSIDVPTITGAFSDHLPVRSTFHIQ
jgi:endonuclease/exonuclease/phosphatase family metal-dependent hydrolase